jgi:hypothetical protein
MADPSVTPGNMGILTLRERQLAIGICAGMTHRQIGEALGIGKRSVDERVQALLHKSGSKDHYSFALERNAAVQERLAILGRSQFQPGLMENEPAGTHKTKGGLGERLSTTGRRVYRKLQPCHCGKCAACQEDANWEKIFRQKIEDPTYYSSKPSRFTSPLHSSRKGP